MDSGQYAKADRAGLTGDHPLTRVVTERVTPAHTRSGDGVWQE
jgi:hypothetical protein